MRLVIALFVGIFLVSCVHIFRPGEIKRRKACIKTIPIHRAEPERPYSVIRMWEKELDDEEHLLYEACAVRADAVIITTEVMSHKFKSRAVLRGLAVKYR